MPANLLHPLICVVGPTASGKTALAQAIAEKIPAAVLSADSMQVYKGMDIGTGKIPEAQRSVAYYGLDIVDPGEAFSASLFQTYARPLVEARDGEGERTVLCGGTGFYVRAVIDDFVFPAGNQIDNPVREFYTSMLHNEGAQAVWNALNSIDPDSARIIPAGDTKRVIRALEIYDEGFSYADQKEQFASIGAYYPSVQIGLYVEPEILAERINSRVDAMMDAGLLNEVETLLSRGFRSAITSAQAIGYKEFVSYLDGQISLDSAVDAVKLATRRYAKRQRTWFRKDKRIHWLDASNFNVEQLCQASFEILDGASV